MSTVRVRLSGTCFGQLMQNVLHFNNPDGTVTETDAAANMRDVWCTLVKKRQISAFTWFSIQVQTLGIGGPTLGVLLPIALSGEISSGQDLVQPTTCAILKLQTAVAGRRGRGRVYLPVPEPGTFFQGVMNGSIRAQWESNVMAPLRTAYLGGSPTSGLNLAVLHRDTSSDVSNAISLEVGAIAGTQRRRQIGVGS